MEEIKKEEKSPKKNHVVLLTVVMVLLLFAFLGIGYALGTVHLAKYVEDKTDKIEKTEEVEKTTEVEKEDSSKELDINSQLVQSLYKLVSEDYDGPLDEFNRNFGRNISDDFYVSQVTDGAKLQLVGYNYVKDSSILNGIVGETDCKSDTIVYTKSQIESVYKNFYGKDAILNTNVDVYFDHGRLVFDATRDGYYACSTIGGGLVLGHITANITKAIQNHNDIKLYQNVKSESMDGLVEEFTLVYTFELEDDGMYKFVSKVKEA